MAVRRRSRVLGDQHFLIGHRRLARSAAQLWGPQFRAVSMPL